MATSWPERRAELLALVRSRSAGPVERDDPSPDDDCADGPCMERAHGHFDEGAYFDAVFEEFGPHRKLER